MASLNFWSCFTPGDLPALTKSYVDYQNPGRRVRARPSSVFWQHDEHGALAVPSDAASTEWPRIPPTKLKHEPDRKQHSEQSAAD